MTTHDTFTVRLVQRREWGQRDFKFLMEGGKEGKDMSPCLVRFTRKRGEGWESRPCKGREEKIWITYSHTIINSSGDER